MHNKLKAILIILLIILGTAGIAIIATTYPVQTQNTFIAILTTAGLYWLFKLILSILENK